MQARYLHLSICHMSDSCVRFRDPIVDGPCTKLHSFCDADVFNHLSSPCCICRRLTWRWGKRLKTPLSLPPQTPNPLWRNCAITSITTTHPPRYAAPTRGPSSSLWAKVQAASSIKLYTLPIMHHKLKTPTDNLRPPLNDKSQVNKDVLRNERTWKTSKFLYIYFIFSPLSSFYLNYSADCYS